MHFFGERTKYNGLQELGPCPKRPDLKKVLVSRIHTLDIIRQFIAGHLRRKYKHNMEHIEQQESIGQHEPRGECLADSSISVPTAKPPTGASWATASGGGARRPWSARRARRAGCGTFGGRMPPSG